MSEAVWNDLDVLLHTMYRISLDGPFVRVFFDLGKPKQGLDRPFR